jgi:hypothetical protein
MVFGQVEDAEDVLDAANTSSVVNTVLRAINNKFVHLCQDEVVSLLIVHPICQLIDDYVSDN